MREKIFSEPQAVVFDLELTSWPGTMERNWSRPGEHREIIQIGAVKIEAEKNFKEVNSFQVLVQSKINPILSDYIINLTGITQEKIDSEGVPFPTALSLFMDFIGKAPTNLFYNGSDSEVIEENCKIYGKKIPPVFKQSIDLKPYFSEALGIPKKECISFMLPELFGLINPEKPHDALGDARSISQVLRHLWKKENY